ncbi:MAG: hypothetical protein A2499_02485 [Stygiobacter sp. RIFOXYC12_FULL_38_8]|nr:MAG: hypothetical protein A2X62_00470 [Stygiobacter sp. GWC2_38_9]OGV07399.1 MAG: hypothetical protein A2299_01085 [Stygiobacter sp. RIFOXYB2_FULL_37_11]OGV14702.1 MAG: hypothetical protein A2440_09355 [Stygiobacter sp. RIFOXYC2_FULL_38_25]OGV18246.1 MAG: hypothetical protein A2237_09580 [Stygiobacter sp. RIFOXYA2_FULL_38_8]OGV25149.1 MAG: hypothetical protein A2499_02485 [Stygiobacter sp. RIFOXYC12_FULL_38_8]OGV79195.1 MAG: hypothetical protein A2X65_01725 [Stygiobacter sp. GWF2_38_21]RJQ
MKITNKIFIAVLFSTLVSPTIFGQWSFGLSTEQEYNDNPFRSKLAEKAFVSSFSGNAGYDFDFLKVGYAGSLISFDVLPERNFYWHQAAAWMEFESSSLGISFEQRLNKDIYTYFDYDNFSLYYNQQIELQNFHITLAPYTSFTQYKSIPILDNLQTSLSATVNRGFETGTTVILGGALNYKRYTSPIQSGTYSYLDETNTLVTETYRDKNVSSVTQVLAFARVAQSITGTTGLATQFTNRSILSGFGAFVKDLNVVYGDESEMFDDPVNYEGNNFSVELTQILFDDLQIKAGYYLNNKNYPSQGIYDELLSYNTGLMRSDTQSIFNLSVKKNISLDSANGLNLSVGLNYQMINNKSNSYLFDYKSNSINLNLGFEL